MELNIIELVGLLLGGSGIVGLIVSFSTIKYMRWKVKSEAKQADSEAKGADAEADMKRQDYYQEIIQDMEQDRIRMKNIREEQEVYITELREDRHRLREEKEALRKENDGFRKMIIELQDKQLEQDDKIAELRRLVESWKPLICVRINCPKRERDILEPISDDSFDVVEEAKKNGKGKK